MQLIKDFATLAMLATLIYAGAVKLEGKAEEPVITEPVVEVTPEPVREVIPREVPKEERYEEPIKDYAKRRVEEKFGPSQWESFNSIVTRESGWNYQAKNRTSGACGLAQANPCSKTLKTHPDYLTNPKAQVEWMLEYIANRYGTPVKAWGFWQKNRYY